MATLKINHLIFPLKKIEKEKQIKYTASGIKELAMIRLD